MARKTKQSSGKVDEPVKQENAIHEAPAKDRSFAKRSLSDSMGAGAMSHAQGKASEIRQQTWNQITALIEQDPQAAYEQWAETMRQAQDELDSGQRAAAAVQLLGTPWEQAQFLAIRQSLAEEWQPARGLEDRLVDMLAHAFEGWLFWMQRSTVRANLQAHVETRSVGEIGKWQTPTVSDVVAVEQSMAMAERLNRIFLRTLRALRDLRRYSPSVTIQSAGQVNIGAQQVNAAMPDGHLGPAMEGGDGE